MIIEIRCSLPSCLKGCFEKFPRNLETVVACQQKVIPNGNLVSKFDTFNMLFLEQRILNSPSCRRLNFFSLSLVLIQNNNKFCNE